MLRHGIGTADKSRQWPHQRAGPFRNAEKVTAMSKALPNKCMSVEEYAEYAGVAPLTIRRLIKAGKLRVVRYGSRIAITPVEIARYEAANG